MHPEPNDFSSNGHRSPEWVSDLVQRFEDVHLDALGLLDEEDREALEAWMATLPQEARLRLRDEQSRLAEAAPTIDSDPPE